MNSPNKERGWRYSLSDSDYYMLVSNKILTKRIFTHEKTLRFKVKKTTIKNTYKPFLNNIEPRNERAGARNQVWSKNWVGQDLEAF